MLKSFKNMTLIKIKKHKVLNIGGVDMYKYYTRGVCSKSITIDIQDGILLDVVFEGGCAGSAIAIKQLIEGKDIDEIIEILESIPCRDRGTSCPDQLANALKIYKEYAINEYEE